MQKKSLRIFMGVFIIFSLLTVSVYAKPPFTNPSDVNGVWIIRKMKLKCDDYEEGKFKAKVKKRNRLFMELQYQTPSEEEVEPGSSGYIPAFAITTFFTSKKPEGRRNIGDGRLYFDFPFNFETECNGTNTCFDGITRIVDGWFKLNKISHKKSGFQGECFLNLTGIISGSDRKKGGKRISANAVGFCWTYGAIDVEIPHQYAGACIGKIKAVRLYRYNREKKN